MLALTRALFFGAWERSQWPARAHSSAPLRGQARVPPPQALAARRRMLHTPERPALAMSFLVMPQAVVAAVVGIRMSPLAASPWSPGLLSYSIQNAVCMPLVSTTMLASSSV